MSATILEWAQLILNGVVVLAGGAVWLLYVKQLKERADFWKEKVEVLERQSPEVMEKRLSERLKIAYEELERLGNERDQDTKEQAALDHEVERLTRTLEMTRGFREMLAMERPMPGDPDYEEFLEYAKSIDSEKTDVEVVYIGSVGVDSGQLMITDPAYIDSQWIEEPFESDRRYRDTKDGSLVTWGDDFVRYDEELEPYGKTPHELVESGRLVQLPPSPAPGTFNFSYNGVCQATRGPAGYGELSYSLGHTGVAVAFGTGWGDGHYPVFAEKHDGRIMRVYLNTGADPVVEDHESQSTD